MTRRLARGAFTVTLLLSVTACGVLEETLEAEEPQGQRDPLEWAAQQFNEEQWGAPGVLRAGGGIGGPDSEAGLDFTPETAGWYSIGMACEDAGSITVRVAATGGELGTGTTGCGSAVTTTMELPASRVTIEVEGAETKGMWALAVAPTEAP